MTFKFTQLLFLADRDIVYWIHSLTWAKYRKLGRLN